MVCFHHTIPVKILHGFECQGAVGLATQVKIRHVFYRNAEHGISIDDQYVLVKHLVTG